MSAVKVKPRKAEGALCECKDTCGHNCLNRALRIECIGHGVGVDEATGLSAKRGRVTPFDTCCVGPGCGNRALQRRKLPALQPFKVRVKCSAYVCVWARTSPAPRRSHRRSDGVGAYAPLSLSRPAAL